jgi:hypothetical protein
MAAEKQYAKKMLNVSENAQDTVSYETKISPPQEKVDYIPVVGWLGNTSTTLPQDILKTALSAEQSMRLATKTPSPSVYETHHPAASIAIIHSDWIKSSNEICYQCRRKVA